VALKNILAETLADALRRLLAVEPFFGSFVYTSLFLLTPVHHQKTQPTIYSPPHLAVQQTPHLRKTSKNVFLLNSPTPESLQRTFRHVENKSEGFRCDGCVELDETIHSRLFLSQYGEKWLW
jgi:hypothetical protein